MIIVLFPWRSEGKSVILYHDSLRMRKRIPVSAFTRFHFSFSILITVFVVVVFPHFSINLCVFFPFWSFTTDSVLHLLCPPLSLFNVHCPPAPSDAAVGGHNPVQTMVSAISAWRVKVNAPIQPFQRGPAILRKNRNCPILETSPLHKKTK